MSENTNTLNWDFYNNLSTDEKRNFISQLPHTLISQQFKRSQIEKASKWFNKYGKWSLLFAWVPVVGDPLTYIAGTMKMRFSIFILLVSIGKIGRYLFISLLI